MRNGWVLGFAVVATMAGGACMTTRGDSRWTLGGKVETPRYSVLADSGDFEVRLYEPMVLAETLVDGTMEQSGTAGFRRIGGYIFGGNQRGESISMTAPVAMQPVDAGRWRVTFMMPSRLKLDTLPAPKDQNVRLTPMPQARMAAVTFTGTWSPESLATRVQALEKAVRAAGLEPDGAPIFARYDPPWTPPFLRRNEILVPLREAPPPAIP